MSQKPITNDKRSPLYVAGVCIQPGETRLFEESDLPPHLRNPAPARPPADAGPDPRAEILKLSVSDFAEHIASRDGDDAYVVAEEDLEYLRGAEASGKARKGIFATIDEEILRRAAEDDGDDEDDPDGASGDEGGENADDDSAVDPGAEPE